MSSSSSVNEKDASPHLSQIGGNIANPAISASSGDLESGPHTATIRPERKIANPAPLGLGAFGLTAFVLSLINLRGNSVTEPSIVVALAFGYGGLVQLLAGMWEMAVGNTFGAMAFSSYGEFWISFGMVLTPAFNIPASYIDKATGESNFHAAFALYLWGWFIFTTVCMLFTLRSTVAFASLFVVLDIAFLCLALAEQYSGHVVAASLGKAGGAFGLVAAFLAWYNMCAGMADSTNFWFKIPVGHLPWSEKKRAERSRV